VTGVSTNKYINHNDCINLSIINDTIPHTPPYSLPVEDSIVHNICIDILAKNLCKSFKVSLLFLLFYTCY
jgi:hypothetical protein